MFRFEKEQKIFEIAGVKIGGQPGQNPPVLIGSIFYTGHEIVKDERIGIFDRKEAESLLAKEAEALDATGLPRILDVVGSYPEALIKFVDFVAEVSDAPFLLDGVTWDVRVKALKHVAEVGLLERAVYNSIAPNAGSDELKAIKESGIKAAVLQALDMRDPTFRGRLNTLRDNPGRRGLLSLASEAGIEKFLIDTTVLDTPDIGIACQAVYGVKEEFGLPAGCGPANAMSMWKKLKKFEPEVLRICDAVSQAFPIALCADFVMYGPIKAAPRVYPACGMIAAYIAYAARFQGIRPSSGHPLTKLMR
ncbi:tetrahydromethanopterin S-methyltransferase subunit H [Candidatus Bathyarchaeota archaeon]|nr:tetrahydromethanopterin S-methyltransferase subunit H [Candidatus Bathyarchaeota archaeon]